MFREFPEFKEKIERYVPPIVLPQVIEALQAQIREELVKRDKASRITSDYLNVVQYQMRQQYFYNRGPGTGFVEYREEQNRPELEEFIELYNREQAYSADPWGGAPSDIRANSAGKQAYNDYIEACESYENTISELNNAKKDRLTFEKEYKIPATSYPIAMALINKTQHILQVMHNSDWQNALSKISSWEKLKIYLGDNQQNFIDTVSKSILACYVPSPDKKTTPEVKQGNKVQEVKTKPNPAPSAPTLRHVVSTTTTTPNSAPKDGKDSKEVKPSAAKQTHAHANDNKPDAASPRSQSGSKQLFFIQPSDMPDAVLPDNIKLAQPGR